MKKKREIIVINKVIPKNLFLQGLMFLKFPLLFPFVKWLIKKDLKHCQNIDFIPGFRYLYGNIYAKNAAFCDSFFIDFAPIYIGEKANFSYGNIFVTSSHDRRKFKKVIAKPIHVGKNVRIATRCIILGGVSIGDNSVIGAGSVVAKDIPANCFASGNPAKVIKYY